MATPVTTATDYCTLLVKSKLLPAEDVDGLYKKWKEERPGSDTRVDSFRRFLVAKRALTEYQAALVQRGRADGFYIAGYKILEQLSKGQMGGVYKAVHNFGQVVALKVLPASKAKNPHVLGRFQREARMLTQLDHANVVRAFQVGEGNGVHFIVMEYLEGETLDEVLDRRERLPAGEAARLLVQALDGLQHLHDRRTVHRDVKPANMMLCPATGETTGDSTWEATLKILDIGLGREMFDDETPKGAIDTQLTQEGSVLGTPDYLAPEQAKDAHTADIRADIYSAGCVLYHCLAGRPPFVETNIMTQMVKHATEAPVPLATVAPDAPKGLQAVLDKMLAKDPGARYQTPAEAAAALKPFATGGAAAVASKVVPAYKDWLASESNLEMPTMPPKPGTAPAPAVKPGTAPAAAVKPTKPSGTTKPGTAPAPAVRPVPAPEPAPVPQPIRPAGDVDVDVELISEPGAPEPFALPAAVPLPVAATEPPAWPPTRRDWIRLCAGAGGVVGTMGVGFVLAKVLKGSSRPADEPNE
jgi:serine/threonine protein kinase